MVYQVLTFILKSTKLIAITVICLMFSSNISVADEKILALSKADFSQYGKSLKFDEYRRYNTSQLYLLNRQLSKPADILKNNVVLHQLEQKVDWSVMPIVTVERINVYLKKKDKTELLDLLVQLSKSPEVSLYEEKIFAALVKAYANNPKPTEIRKVLKQLLPVLNWWRQDSQLILWSLEYLDIADSEYTALVKQLWETADVTSFPASYNSYLKKLKKTPTVEPKIIADHFSNQYRFKNWSYIIAEAPYYLARLPHGSPEFSKIREVYIKSFLRKRQYTQLIQLLNSTKQSRWLSFTAEEKAVLLFQAWLRKGWSKKAIEYLSVLEKTVPRAELVNRYFELAEFFYGKKQFKKSLKFFDRVTPGAEDEHLVPIVQWRKLRIFQVLNKSREMKKIAIWADSYAFQSREVASKFCYWGVKLKLYAQRSALSCYQRYPYTYYGFRSLRLGEAYSGIDKAMFAKIKKKKNDNLSLSELEFLSFVNVLYLSDEGVSADVLVMRYLKKRISKPFFTNLMDVLYRNERFYLQQLLIDLYFKETLYDGGSEQSRLLVAYYPMGYPGEVARHIGQSDMSPMLVYAVIREESNFRSEVESPAGAVGLMQLMPSTAKYIAKITRTKYKRERLVDPDINVKLGVAYLKRLLRRYKGNLYYTLAAYNGGATNVKRWMRANGAKDLDVFVESITFIETQNYVKRVLRSYYIYQILYD